MSEAMRKSFYIFMTMLLGALLGVMLQRLAFLFAFFFGADVGSLEAQALSVVTSAIAGVFGAWYGIWLGLHWYAAIYEERSARGFVGSIIERFAIRRKSAGAWEFDDLLAMQDSTGRTNLAMATSGVATEAGARPAAVTVKPAAKRRAKLEKMPAGRQGLKRASSLHGL